MKYTHTRKTISSDLAELACKIEDRAGDGRGTITLKKDEVLDWATQLDSLSIALVDKEETSDEEDG